MKFVKHDRIWLKDHPELNERWVQTLVADDPRILGLGDLVLKDKERRQPHAGRLDLLLQDPDSDRRYEVDEAYRVRRRPDSLNQATLAWA